MDSLESVPVSDGQVTDLLTWQTGDQTEPLGGGEMSVCGSEFGYVYADHGQCVLIRAGPFRGAGPADIDSQEREAGFLLSEPGGDGSLPVHR